MGQSCGGLLCLLAAAAHPQTVWTLTVIEPTATSIARGNEAVERLIARLAPLFPPDPAMSPEQFAAAFYQALGGSMRHRLSWMSDSQQRRRPPPVSRRPGTSKCLSIASRLHPFDTRCLRRLGHRATPSREIAGTAFRVICDTLAEKLPAERAVFRGAAHKSPASRQAIQ